MKRILLSFLLACPMVVPAQLVLDHNFGNNGFSVIGWPTNGIARMYAQLQTDGKIIVSGNRIASVTREDYVLRLNADGAIDPTYANNGFYTIPPAATQDLQGPELFLLPNDHVVTYSSNYGSLFTKLTPEGIVDPAFNQTAGYSPFYSQEFSFADPGRNYIYFIKPGPPYGLQRISTGTGLLDTTFGNAEHYISVPGGFNSDAEATAQADGKITIIRETGSLFSDIKQCYAHRMLADGTADPNFGTNGSALLYETTESFSEREECLVYDDSGALYVGSRNWETFDGSTLYKHDANGQPVLSFGTDGKIVLPDDHFILDVYVHEGHLYAIGRRLYSDNFSDCDLMIAKYSLDGTPDSSFGANGIYIENGNSLLESGEDLIFMPDGSLIVAGETNEGLLHRPFLAKYNFQALGSNDFTAGQFSYTNPITDQLVVNGKGITHIGLFSIEGKPCRSVQGNTVSTDGLSAGLYLAQIGFENGSLKTVKVIKQ